MPITSRSLDYARPSGMDNFELGAEHGNVF